MIALDRPGIGHSVWKAGYHLLDWPDDVQEVDKQLGIERFGIIGSPVGEPMLWRVPTKSRIG